VLSSGTCARGTRRAGDAAGGSSGPIGQVRDKNANGSPRSMMAVSLAMPCLVAPPASPGLSLETSLSTVIVRGCR
jgi:hypothetical protein